MVREALPRMRIRWSGPWLRWVGVISAASVLIAVGIMPLAAGLGLGIIKADRAFNRGAMSQIILPPLPARSTIYAADGSVLAHVWGMYDRAPLPLSQIAPVARRAVLAAEDHGYYSHGAIDPASILRALLVNLRAGEVLQGGSTIAQQLMKNLYTGNADTIARKIREAQDALALEAHYSKNQILDAYLNYIYLGNGLYGVETAAERYFDVPASRLSLPQAATLAGMIDAPALTDPVHHHRAALARRNWVLGRMSSLGWITQADYAAAIETPLRVAKRHPPTLRDPRWVQLVVGDFLGDPQFGPSFQARAQALYEGGLRIYTTLRPRLERAANAIIKRRMGGPGMPQSALVSLVPQTGAVEAMAVGNWPWPQHRYDLAVDPGGGRTAGSSFKAYTLAAALEKGVSPAAVYDGSSPRTIPDCGGGQTWTVHNAEPGSGSYPLWEATADSVNVVFAQVIDQVGPRTVADVAHRMGITSPLVPVCPLTLGTSPVSPFEMTSGYSTLANGGVHCRPYVIASIASATGQRIYRARPSCTRAIPAWVAAEETAMLQGVIRFGTGTAAQLCPSDCRPEAGKTGTGENFQDAWFLGYVPQLATGVWVGYGRAEVPMPDVPGYGEGFGGTLAAPIWHDFMLVATRGMPVREFPSPPQRIPTAPPAPPVPTPTTPPSTAPPPPPTPAPSPSH
jgi:penicillin-binding protein 1A